MFSATSSFLALGPNFFVRNAFSKPADYNPSVLWQNKLHARKSQEGDHNADYYDIHFLIQETELQRISHRIVAYTRELQFLLYIFIACNFDLSVSFPSFGNGQFRKSYLITTIVFLIFKNLIVQN